MAGAVAHPSTLIKTSKLPSGDSRVEVSGIFNPVNNPLNTLNKSVSDRSHPSLDKSLIPKMQPTLIRDQPLVPVCACISSVSLHISPIAQIHPTSQSVGRIRKPDRQQKPPTVGAVISDTGTETCIWGKEVKNRLYDVQPLSEPVRLQVASGAHMYTKELKCG